MAEDFKQLFEGFSCAALSTIAGLAKGDGSRGFVLRDHQAVSRGGAVWIDESNPSRRRICAGEHRRRTRSIPHQGILEPSEYCARLLSVIGNRIDDQPARRLSGRRTIDESVGDDR